MTKQQSQEKHKTVQQTVDRIEIQKEYLRLAKVFVSFMVSVRSLRAAH